MYEDAQGIFNYLPINKTNTLEEEYIIHLWQSFVTLADSENQDAAPFCVFPFHLLFMLAVQYKILRISKLHTRDFDLAFTFEGQRNRSKGIIVPESVFELAEINESSLFDLLKLIDVKEDLIKSCKKMVKNRNNQMAHAKGGIEVNPEEKINEYLKLLERIQINCENINNFVAEQWLAEMGTGEEGVEYIESHLGGAYLCPADMQQGKLAKLEDRLNSQ